MCLSFECPPVFGDQDALIEAVAEANPRTVVVIVSGGPVLTPWRKRVGAVLEAWYPGSEGGSAISRVLFGAVDAQGRLPATFPRSEAELPTAGDESAYPGVGDIVTYDEGMLVGYRHYDAKRISTRLPVRPRPLLHPLPLLRLRARANRDQPAKPSGAPATVERHRHQHRRPPGRRGARSSTSGCRRGPERAQPPKASKGFKRVTLAPEPDPPGPLQARSPGALVLGRRAPTAGGSRVAACGSWSAAHPARHRLARPWT